MKAEFHSSISDLNAEDWNALLADDHPFLHHQFLHCLESSGSVCADTGWQPCHLSLHHNGQLLAAMPLYLKYHSWGEYVFDWSWAEAYQRLGLPYYPKLLSAVPFTPATGPRLLIAPGADRRRVIQTAIDAIQQYATKVDASGFHLLFPGHHNDALLQQLPKVAGQTLQRRTGTQFHWRNRNYRNFDHFLETLNSRRRKTIRSERRRVENQPLTIELVPGIQANSELWRAFYPLYHRTYLKRSGAAGYLNEVFFRQIGKAMPEKILLAVARRESGEIVAGSLFFRDHHTLYGRYWGAASEYDALHFELCYYRGIEYAIEHGLQTFDAGAQGEHKIKRGFEPVETCSWHWLADGRFGQAIEQFLAEERQLNKLYLADACRHLPYKK